jgi:hypothetical protein
MSSEILEENVKNQGEEVKNEVNNEVKNEVNNEVKNEVKKIRTCQICNKQEESRKQKDIKEFEDEEGYAVMTVDDFLDVDGFPLNGSWVLVQGNLLQYIFGFREELYMHDEDLVDGFVCYDCFLTLNREEFSVVQCDICKRRFKHILSGVYDCARGCCCKVKAEYLFGHGYSIYKTFRFKVKQYENKERQVLKDGTLICDVCIGYLISQGELIQLEGDDELNDEHANKKQVEDNKEFGENKEDKENKRTEEFKRAIEEIESLRKEKIHKTKELEENN